jgi:membrane-associated phospholipid phosphatase
MERLMRTGAFLIVSLMLLAGAAHADECDVTWSSVGEDFQALFEAPFNMDQDAAYLTLGVTAFTGASIIWFDDDVDGWVRRQPDSLPYNALHQFSRVASWYGESNKNAFISYAAVTGAVALGGAIADDDYVVDTAALMLESGVFTFALNAAVKLIVGRKRPHSGESHEFEFFVGPRDSDTQAFFSGHTSAAFAGAGVAAGRHPHWYVEVPSYLFAVAAGWQRIDSRSHWLSDVVAGGFFGYAISELLVDRHECPESSVSGAATPTVSFTVRF